jgi:hypothetical protein
MAPSSRPGRLYCSERCRKRAERCRWHDRQLARRRLAIAEAMRDIAVPLTAEFLNDLPHELEILGS